MQSENLTSRRRIWQAAHYWSIIRMRRRIVIGTFLVSLSATVAYTWSRTWIYSAEVVIRNDSLDSHGFDTNAMEWEKKKLYYGRGF